MIRIVRTILSAVVVAVLVLAGCDEGLVDPDQKPAFETQRVSDQTYTAGTAITALVLPAATGGDGRLTYSLKPTVPGLEFTAATRTLSGTPTASGSHSMTYRVVDSDGDAASLEFVLRINPPPDTDTKPSFGSQTVSDQTYTAGTAITALVLPAATGGDGRLTYSLTPAVPGLGFTAATRTLSGTPTASGSHSMTYRVVDSDGDAATLKFVLQINPVPVSDTKPSFGSQTVSDQTYTAGTAITALVLPAATGGDGRLTYSLTPAVPGLGFTAATRTLSGTPTASGSHSMTYRVADSDGDAATLKFVLQINPVPVSDTKPSFGSQTVSDQTYTAGTPITALVLPAATGGDGRLTYSLMPAVPGLEFMATVRTLSGTPTASGSHSMTYRVVDSDGDAATLKFVLQINPVPVSDTKPSFGSQTVSDQTYTAGTAITALVLPAATGGDGRLTYSLMPAVPGLEFTAATRTLSGTPTASGSHSMTYRVVDSDGDAATLKFVLQINPPDPACPAHSATQIVGDWIADSVLFGSDWVFSFRADATFQINDGAVTINDESEGNYSYDATTCTLAWRGTDPGAEPGISILVVGSIQTVTITGTNKHFVDWNGPDSFCERSTAESSFCISMYTRRP